MAVGVPFGNHGIRIVSLKPGNSLCRQDWERAPCPLPMILCQLRCVTYARGSPCLHASVCLIGSAGFSGDVSQEKVASKCEKSGTRHLALTSVFCASFTFESRPTLRVGSDCIFSPFQKLGCECHVHKSHLLGCLSTAPALQTTKSRGCQELGTPLV